MTLTDIDRLRLALGAEFAKITLSKGWLQVTVQAVLAPGEDGSARHEAAAAIAQEFGFILGVGDGLGSTWERTVQLQGGENARQRLQLRFVIARP